MNKCGKVRFYTKGTKARSDRKDCSGEGAAGALWGYGRVENQDPSHVFLPGFKNVSNTADKQLFLLCAAAELV